VFWVKQAQKDHDVFAEVMRAEGVEVLDTGVLLGETLDIAQARAWVLDQRITPQEIGVGMLDDLRAWMDALPGSELAAFLIGGLTVDDLPFEPAGMFGAYLGRLGFVLPPLPNTLFTRDNSSWVYSGVTLNPMFWQARRPETLLTAAIYRFHPKFAGRVEVLWGDPTRDYGRATREGGDVTSAGSVNFREVAEDATEVRVKLQYAPPGGHVGAAAFRVLGTDAAQQVREDLRSLKQALEAFHAAGAPSFT
jgi:arginine deiminase